MKKYFQTHLLLLLGMLVAISGVSIKRISRIFGIMGN